MTEIRRYSVWLLPEEPAADTFKRLIDNLSERYFGPKFAPHVTLLGWVTGSEARLIEKTKALAADLRTLHPRSVGLDGESYYFRCLYAKLEKSTELLEAHALASEAFGGGYAQDYLPHLSLLYGHLPRTEKTMLYDEMRDRVLREFTIDRLQLVRITVSVQDWQAVVACTLPAGI
ncbi:MAG: 2'-5' RNA ligase family protein [Acidiferrobacterales bacterium]